ncbi:MAG: hypothetical protein PW845_28135 [Pseudomonas sp.]|uniref:hypothetical protein n=1 Tax=Pseudomonas abieticivorans TaxID=2931382 RepID=UPI0020C16701|nr:hypothetical protein [Pseudomonas sp. PIA16]MDE1169149.1 hypothetical protein [Pseudomonas sp.]
MLFRSLRGVAALAGLCAVLTGCANTTQKPIDLDAQFWSDKSQSIGVAMTNLPESQLALVGNQGLLDLAINKGINSKLSTQVSTWKLKDTATIPDEIVAKLKAKGYTAKRIDEIIDVTQYKEIKFREGFYRRDLTPLQAKYGVDRLLLISYTASGAFRSYYSVVPTSVPTPQVGGVGAVVDLHDNHLLWWKPFVVVQPAQGEWDQPNYSNLANAYYQAVDSSRQMVITPFAQ